jgi:DNA primase
VTTAWAAEKRVGKVFLDYNQNRLGATLASAYSVRPTPEATVSMPVSWKELQQGLDPLEFTLETVPALMRKRRDPWANLLAKPQLLEKHL